MHNVVIIDDFSGSSLGHFPTAVCSLYRFIRFYEFYKSVRYHEFYQQGLISNGMRVFNAYSFQNFFSRFARPVFSLGGLRHARQLVHFVSHAQSRSHTVFQSAGKSEIPHGQGVTLKRGVKILFHGKKRRLDVIKLHQHNVRTQDFGAVGLFQSLLVNGITLGVKEIIVIKHCHFQPHSGHDLP